MSGVGTRLEQLRALRARIDHEIAHEEAVLAQQTQHLRRTASVAATTDVIADRLDELGVTALDVKRWAVTAGLVDRVRRGRVALALVDDYAHAHTEQGATT